MDRVSRRIERLAGHARELRVRYSGGAASERSLDFVDAPIEGSKTGLNRF
jgi:hypothetical protein